MTYVVWIVSEAEKAENLKHTMLDKLWWAVYSIQHAKLNPIHGSRSSQCMQLIQFGPEHTKLTLVRRKRKNGCKYALWEGDICLKREYVPFSK